MSEHSRSLASMSSRLQIDKPDRSKLQNAALHITRLEAIVAERESRVPTQETIDRVAEGLAGMAIRYRDADTAIVKACGVAIPPSTSVGYGLLLTLLGIPDGSDWAARALENHHDTPANLVEALRQMKDLHEMPIPEPNMETVAEAHADYAAGRYQTPKEIIDELEAGQEKETTKPGILESYVIEKTAICKHCDEPIRWAGEYWEHTGTQYRHMGQPKGQDE